VLISWGVVWGSGALVARGGARTKVTSVLGKKHTWVEIIDYNQQSQASACDFAYLAGGRERKRNF
jgi:hypothetical protein